MNDAPETWQCRRCNMTIRFPDPQRWVEHDCNGPNYTLIRQSVRLHRMNPGDECPKCGGVGEYERWPIWVQCSDCHGTKVVAEGCS